MKQNEKAAYWNERAKRYGHTGWADGRIYAYDQQVRIELVEHILKKYKPHLHYALDFGCGTGDLTRVLARHADAVNGFDISNDVLIKANELTEQKNIQYRSNQKEVLNDSLLYDVILSVTVLQHILDEEEFLNTLQSFSKFISPDGIFIALETLSNDDPQKTDYSITRNKSEYIVSLEKAGFSILESKRFYSPLSNDVTRCQIYMNSIVAKALCKMRFSSVLKQYAKKYLVSPEQYLFEESIETTGLNTYLIVAQKYK